MKIVARAPGKLVLIGEYAVLAGAPALVAAVDRHCTVEIEPRDGGDCELRTRMQSESVRRFPLGAGSGSDVVDSIASGFPVTGARPWTGTIDSTALFDARAKLGLGSSAAALTAWAGAWQAFHRRPTPSLAELIEASRGRRGSGSGIDIAASLRGGVSRYAVDASGIGTARSARLPDGVAFAAIATGRPASTPAFLAQFERWRASRRSVAAALLERLTELATSGVDASLAGDAPGFLAAIAAYGQGLAELGRSIGADIVTHEHLELGCIAEQRGVAYKVSGAGGGDIGLAFAASRTALDAFIAAASATGQPLSLGIDLGGLEITARAS